MTDFDYFNEGLDPKGESLKFSAQEEQFFEAKLKFLDPGKGKSIQMADALSMLKYSGLKGEDIKMVLQSAGVNLRQNPISYHQMKLILRAVGLKQHGIHPSQMNLNANIKNKLPIFHDSDDQEESPQSQRIQQPQHIQQQQRNYEQKRIVSPNRIQQGQRIQEASPRFQQQPQRNTMTVNEQKQPNTQNLKVPLLHLSPQMKQFQQGSIEQPVIVTRSTQNIMNPDLRNFEQYWKNVQQVQGRVDGREVKRLFKNSNEKNNLSQAWRICNLSEQKSLSKGQFYAFLKLCPLKQIPSSMPSQLRGMVEEIDGKLTTTTATTHQNTTYSPRVGSPSSFDFFQGFGNKSSAPTTAGSNKVAVMQPKRQSQKKPSMQEMKKPSIEDLREQQVLRQKKVSLQQEFDIKQKVMQEMVQKQKVMTRTMEQMQKWLQSSYQRERTATVQIERLRQGNFEMNNRTQGLLREMQQLIGSQSNQISALILELNQQTESSAQKIAALEGMVQCLQQALRQPRREQPTNERHSGTLQIESKLQQESNTQGGSGRDLGSSEGRNMRRINQVQREVMQNRSDTVIQQARREQTGNNSSRTKIQSDSRREIEVSVDRRENKVVQQGRNETKRGEEEDRKTMKRRMVMQLIYFIKPMSEPQHSQVMERINGYNEEQLDQAYTALYAKYQEKQAAESKPNERESMSVEGSVVVQ